MDSAKTKAGRPRCGVAALSDTECRAAADLRVRGASWEMVAAILDRTVGSVQAGVRTGRIVLEPVQESPLLTAADYRRMPGRRPWTDAEDLLLADAYGPEAPHPQTTGGIASRLHRPASSVNRRAAILGLSRKENGRKTKAAARAGSACRPWTQDDDSRLAELWRDNGVLAVARELDREPEDVRRRAARIVRDSSRPVRASGDWWTGGEDTAIRLLYPLIGAAPLAARMGRTVEAVEHRARIVMQGIEAARSAPENSEEKNYFLELFAETEEPRAICENS